MTNTKRPTKNIEIAYIGGGSRGWAWTFMTDLSLEAEFSGTIRLYDIDHKASKINEKIGNDLKNDPKCVSGFTYRSVNSFKQALSGADFVVISILPGTFDEMDSDVHTPERHGIYQSVGDTAGPGGMIRALRTIPMFVEIGEAVKKYAPEAWVINYTNPMSLCVKTLYETFPQIKAFGCCHEVFNTQELLAAITAEELKLKKIPRRDIHTNVIGINHFTWFTRASYKDHDIFPIYDKYVKQNYETGYEFTSDNWMNSVFGCAHRVKFDLYRRYHYIAAAGDRHLAEFMPGDLYLKDPETVRKWKFSLTPVSWRKADLEERLARSERLYTGKEKLPLKATGEEGVKLIKALCGLGDIVSNVNLPNYALQIANLEPSAIVETNALFGFDSLSPIYAGKLPEDIKALIMPHVRNHRLIYEAAIEKDRKKVYKAFKNDPLINKRINDKQIKALVDDMISNTSKYCDL
ncbi:MAG: alpha-glucosidase/alpha-galactosidase [Erysipelotrichaceae bacterium]|nr:alpha-glucosidase/alpha-galactosidase [Erysipelotrichaceae bacterium]